MGRQHRTYRQLTEHQIGKFNKRDRYTIMYRTYRTFKANYYNKIVKKVKFEPIKLIKHEYVNRKKK